MGSRHLALVALLVLSASAEQKLRFCATPEINEDSCTPLEKGNSPVRCRQASSSADCAVKLAENKADFGIFTADELVLAQHFYPTGLQVVAELRNRDKLYDSHEFQSVVVVTKNYTPTDGFSGLIGAGFCHPGFSKTQLWSDHVLKYFEQKVLTSVCRRKMTVSENEIIDLKEYFKKGCRPGDWTRDSNLNKQLKKKYPQMCELCDNTETCKYKREDHHGHVGALDCLTSGRGNVAYVALHYAQEYFGADSRRSKYQLLCEDGTVMPVDSSTPCTWFKEPWRVVVAREDKVSEVLSKLEQASASTFKTLSWEETLNRILFRDYSPSIYSNHTTPTHYLARGRGVEVPRSVCGSDIRWCTVSDMERSKCKMTSVSALILGIKPAISCIEAQSVFECFVKIERNEADIITIDSNYGHLARKVYGLSPIMYCDTLEMEQSVVVAAIRDGSSYRRISRWSEVKDSKACFPEYGGIAWLSFVNSARNQRIISNSCKYTQVVANLVDKACSPGLAEANHFINQRKPSLKDDLAKLCDLCPIQSNGEKCEASYLNAYYGDKGALDCLKQGSGDIAVLEARNIIGHIKNGSILPDEYRVLCKNGSLAQYTGFYVDNTCALSVTIDSEVVARRNLESFQQQDMILALLKIEDWLGYRGDSARRLIRVYSPFNDTENIMFKDSTVGLLATNEQTDAVQAYRDLFNHVDECSGAFAVVSVITLVVGNFFLARFI